MAKGDIHYWMGIPLTVEVENADGTISYEYVGPDQEEPKEDKNGKKGTE